MTYRNDAARGADVLGRWRMLAEQRLEHLTELFESGRWRRYHSERTFLENIKEAKSAVETWRGLSTQKAIPQISIARPKPAQSILMRALEPVPVIAPEPIKMPAAMEAELEAADEAPARPALDLLALERTLDVPAPGLDFAAIAQRYPLLRTTL
jgi:uncharacterized repeat protein (TIGR03809 family)